MMINRRFLYWGVFLVVMGGVMVAVDLKGISTSVVEDALRLWPLAVVALGVAVLLRRTRFNVAAWLVAAALPGLAFGGVLAVGPRLVVDCGDGEPSVFESQQGSFEGPARIEVTTGCGSLSVSTAPGSGWRFEAGNTANATARVSSSASSLSIDAGRRGGPFGFTGGRDVWRLTLPTSAIEDLSLVVNVGEGNVDLAGSQIGSLDLTTNAGSAVVDLSEASVGRLSATLNAGALSIRLPNAQDLSGSLDVNAGGLRVCIPDGLGVRVDHQGVLSSTSYGGLEQNGSVWQSPDYELAAHHADLSVNVNLGSVELDPIGGCK